MALSITITDPATGTTRTVYASIAGLNVARQSQIILRLHDSRAAKYADRATVAPELRLPLPPPIVSVVDGEQVLTDDPRTAGEVLREHMRAADADPIRAGVYRYLKSLAEFAGAGDVLE